MSERHDRDEIADVLLRYTVGIDRRDWKLFRTCFTDHCTIDYGDFGAWQGADAFRCRVSRRCVGGRTDGCGSAAGRRWGAGWSRTPATARG
ncbi:nuclear transport factor 2 family protein [Frankia sp. AgB32]|nr:nuclear transport factor 2 family protein [Frankia sp. AgB32]MCK9895191.1 nuclear transport factor 2 family protein [Frankia sp. AgB32]